MFSLHIIMHQSMYSPTTPGGAIVEIDIPALVMQIPHHAYIKIESPTMVMPGDLCMFYQIQIVGRTPQGEAKICSVLL